MRPARSPVAPVLVASLIAVAPLALPTGARADDPRLVALRAAPVPVLVVGTYHMNNPGRDVQNLEADDVLSPGRQTEIEAVVKGLASLAPTRVCVEVPWTDPDQEVAVAGARKEGGYDRRYPEYVRGELPPDRNEVYQLGFRLAKTLGHDRVYAVDVGSPHGGYRWDLVVGFAEANGMSPVLEMSEGGVGLLMQASQAKLAELSVGDYLRYMNQPERLLGMHRGYVDGDALISANGEYAGPDAMAAWYGRNVRIFSNVARIAEPGDRIVVLFGAGHAHYLRQLFEESSYFELVDLDEVLG